MVQRAKRPRDPNQLGKLIVDIATGAAEDLPSFNADKNEKMVALGQKGGIKGGNARAAAMTPEQRSESARRAAKARWGKAP